MGRALAKPIMFRRRTRPRWDRFLDERLIGRNDNDAGGSVCWSRYLLYGGRYAPEPRAHFALKGDLGPVNGEFHSLKIQILTGELAIGFAGNFDVAYSAVAALKLALSVDPTLDPTEWLASRSITDAIFLS
jgi:hypothetical protein